MATGIRRLDDPAGVDEHGRPTNDTVRDRILKNCRVGLPAEIAAQAAGIAYRTFVLWLQAGRSALTELDADPQALLTDEQRLAAVFAVDVDQALGAWLSNANLLLEAETRRQDIVTVTERTAADGTVLERTTTTRTVPGDTGRLAWRMGKVNPAVYGRDRIEVTGADGGPVEVGIDERLTQVLADIAATLTVDHGSNGNGVDVVDGTTGSAN